MKLETIFKIQSVPNIVVPQSSFIKTELHSMAEVTIRLRDNGPLVVQGPVQIVDAEGNVFTIAPDKPAVALCRCGNSGNKPFCDGSHKTCGFLSAERASG